MRSILKHVGRLAAFLVAAVLAMTLLSTAPGSAAPAKSAGSSTTLPASTSATPAVSARTIAARKAPACWRRHHRCYGSIAVNPARKNLYFANDRLTKSAARTTALKKCRRIANYHKYCRYGGWVSNGCLAAAARLPEGPSGYISQWATAVAATKQKAIKKAKAKLGGPARKHYLWGYLCTTRRA